MRRSRRLVIPRVLPVAALARLPCERRARSGLSYAEGVTSIEIARQEWEEGSRRLEAAHEEGGRYRQLLELLELVRDELRKRIGQTYTLQELVAAYGDAERWAREVLEERAAGAGWPRDLSIVLAAAFDTYQRGAVDYEP